MSFATGEEGTGDGILVFTSATDGKSVSDCLKQFKCSGLISFLPNPFFLFHSTLLLVVIDRQDCCVGCHVGSSQVL